MTVQVVSKLRVQAASIQLQSGKVKSQGVLGRVDLSMQQSMSNLKHRDKSSPGKTISPSPNKLNFISSSSIQGSCNLSGKLMLLATVTITSLAQTQQRSQNSSSHNTAIATLMDLRLPSLTARILKPMAKKLSMSQCFVTTSRRVRLSQKSGLRPYLITKDSVLRAEGLKSHRMASQFSISRRQGRVMSAPYLVVAMTKTVLRRVSMVT